MSPLLSTKGRSVGKLLEQYQSSTLGLGIGSGEATDESPNYWGEGDDGDFNSTGNVTYTVLNKNGSYDGDMVVRHYNDFTLSSGHTITTDQPCRGLMIFVKGNAVISGTISMKGRGALANPNNAGSDGNSVQAAGIQIPMRNISGIDTLAGSASLFNGFGDKARLASANFPEITSTANGTIYRIVKIGGADTAAYGNNNGGAYSAKFANGNTIADGTGGGGQGGCGHGDGDGEGRAGTCFGGGSGGGGGNNNGVGGDTNATAWGGQGGLGVSKHTARCTGGAGNPNGTESTTGGYSNAVNSSNGESGTGGIILMFVQGSLTITGTITANGSRSDSIDGNGYNWCSTGGGSGGGAIRIFHKGILTNTGTVTANGGVAGVPFDDGDGRYSGEGGNGGNGTVQIVATL